MENALIFQIDEKFIEADAIKSYEWNEYHPTSGSDLDVPGTITINIELSLIHISEPTRPY